MIPYGRQDISDADVAAVVEVLRSDFLTQGPVVPRFERALAQRVGAKHAVASNSATSSLHTACMALGLGRGDWLWTSPNSFVASANCGVYCGADIDFVDIDPRTFNIDPKALRTKLEAAKQAGRLPKVLVVVHMCGQSADMQPIAQAAREYGVRIIEDASHAVGGSYQGRPIGCCQYSDIVVFSFHPVKIITTAEGGMALTQDDDLAKRLARARSHGITRDVQEMDRAPDGPWYYQQIDLGYNYRMTELQAVLGLSQLERLEPFVARRNALAQRYDRLLADLPLVLPSIDSQCVSAFHLYVVQVDKNRGCAERADLVRALHARGVAVNVHYIPIHTQPFYAQRGFKTGDFPLSEAYYSGAVSLPMYATLSDQQQDQVVAALKESVRA
jgi:UDP-4-amino-4,6-dideoxy-N-acetyl-beta-L-altrosamine transaminase